MRLLRLMTWAALVAGLVAAGRAEAAMITRSFAFEATFDAAAEPFLPVNPMRFALSVTYDDSVLMGSGDPQTAPVVLSSNFPITFTQYYYLPDFDALGFYVYPVAGYAIVNGQPISGVPVFDMNFNFIDDTDARFFVATSVVVSAVPLPASLGLFGIGLVGLALARVGHAGRRRLAVTPAAA